MVKLKLAATIDGDGLSVEADETEFEWSGSASVNDSVW